MEEEKIVKAQEILQGLYYGYGKEKTAGIGEYYRSLSCFSSSGKVMAAVNNFVWYRPDGINIYSSEEGTEMLLYQLPVPTTEAGWPIGIWQMKGDQSSGWVVFSYGFSIYVDRFSNYSSFYGATTTIALAMVWLYGCMYMIFLGGLINRLIED